MNKNVIITIVVLLIVGGLFYLFITSDGNEDTDREDDMVATTTEDSVNEEEVVLEEGEYDIATSDSSLVWIGSKTLVEGYEDIGTLDIESGSFTVEDGQIVDGEVVLDMNSITAIETSNTQLGLSRLDSHLKSDDFFNVETYPTATFVVNEVDKTSNNSYDLMGELTLAGETAPVTVPVTIISAGEGQIVMDSDFAIDRTDWNVTYGSGSFFDNLGDNVIDDMIRIELSLVAETSN